MRMTVNIVVFIDCYSTIYIENYRKINKKLAHAYFKRFVLF